MVKNSFLILTLIFLCLLAFNFAVNGSEKNKVCLEETYSLYKKNFVTEDGRVIDFQRDSITTSEGQSYMLLRSLIMDDREAFDLVYTWSKNNLQRKDHLFSWFWGKDKKSGEYKILDDNSASDADVDIAFALILAYKQWGQYDYLQKALPIIYSIWDNETKRIGNQLVLVPGAKQCLEDKIEINPSYFSPYAFKLFQKFDDRHDWSLLVDSSYYYLKSVTAKTKSGLPPDWFLIEDNKVVLEDTFRSDFSYDAIRVFPRIYLDYSLTGEKRALPILEKAKFFINNWNNYQTIYTNYKSNGELRNKDVFAGGVAILLPIISQLDNSVAVDIYNNQKVNSFLNENYWTNKDDYYGKNLAWFGLYFYQKNIRKCELKK